MKKASIIHEAQIYATQAHKRIDHRRKYSNQPYDVHLKAVADMVSSATEDAEMIAAAWLHDVIEDTPATLHDIEQTFGKSISLLVSELTDVSKSSDGNRSTRKAIDREYLSKASSRTKTIKLADIIDNCKDICKHDKRFARTFLSEIMLLIEVLTDGEKQLYEKAIQVINQCAEELGLSHTIPMNPMTEPGVGDDPLPFSRYRAQATFINAFSAKDIAEPFRSFGMNEKANEVAEMMKDMGIEVAGIQKKGVTEGYIYFSDLATGLCGDNRRRFHKGQILSSEASLTDVIQVLTRHDYCFISMCDAVFGVIDRSDIQKPVVRMWLFGMITLIEMFLLDRIKNTLPGDKWESFLSPERLEKARELLKKRERINHRCSLLDCLQLSDKVKIILEDKALITAFGFKSKRAVKQTIKELESLRNNLAHAQDIVTHDWPQIARMTKNMESGFGNL